VIAKANADRINWDRGNAMAGANPASDRDCANSAGKMRIQKTLSKTQRSAAYGFYVR
jgi:hypothetical protein